MSQKARINNVKRLNSKSNDILLKSFKARVISEDPYIVKIKNFVSDEEIESLMKLSKGKFVRSNIMVDGILQYDNMRTSNTAYLCDDGLPNRYDDNIERLIKRIKYLTGCKREEIEGFMMVSYSLGQKFDSHVDYFKEDEIGVLDSGGQRISTFFVYLNSVHGDSGGETEFTKLNIKFKPRKGEAIFWWNKDPKTDRMLPLTEHRGNPVNDKNIIKYGLNIWQRNQAFY